MTLNGVNTAKLHVGALPTILRTVKDKLVLELKENSKLRAAYVEYELFKPCLLILLLPLLPPLAFESPEIPHGVPPREFAASEPPTFMLT